MLCLQLFPVLRNKEFFVFQSSKNSSLKIRLPISISFAIPLEFDQFDKKYITWFLELL